MIFSISLMKIKGSSTTPLPIILTVLSLKIPEGIECKTCLKSPNSRECPAFGPP